MNNSEIKSRILAVKIIRDSVLGKDSLKSIYNKYLNNSNVSDLDKRFITEIVNGTIRMFKRVDYYISHYYKGKINNLEKLYLIILRTSVYQLKYMSKVPDYAVVSTSVEITKIFFPKYSNLTNALLRKISNEKLKFHCPDEESSNDYLSIYYSHPKWLIDKWAKKYSYSSLISLLEFNNKTPRTWFRYNKNKVNILDIENELKKHKVNLEINQNLENFFSIKNASLLLNSQIFMDGKIFVQNPTNGLIVKLLNPLKDEKIIDVCAAPGGKTLSILEEMNRTGEITAYDINTKRVNSMIENFNKHDIENVKIIIKDVSKDKLISSSKILADVPCLGTGTIAKNPDLKWRKKAVDINRIVKLQEEILNNSSKYLNPNGIIVYSTCSIEDEENWMVIDKFLANHPNYIIDHADNYVDSKFTDSKGAINIKPYKHNLDGGFAVRLVNYEN